MVERANYEMAGLSRRSGRIPALPYPPIKPPHCITVGGQRPLSWRSLFPYGPVREQIRRRAVVERLARAPMAIEMEVPMERSRHRPHRRSRRESGVLKPTTGPPARSTRRTLFGRRSVPLEEHGLDREFFEAQVDRPHFGTSAMDGARGNCDCVPGFQGQ
jgi:hypothetical protein